MFRACSLIDVSLFVYRQKSKNFPSKSKYFFLVKAVNAGVEPYHTLQSVKTDEYVRCDDDGKVSMKKATKRNSHGVPEDRGMWFNYMPHGHKMQQHVFSQQQIMYAKVSQVISNECEQFQDDKDSGEKRFNDPENGSADDSGKGTPCDPEEGHMNDTDKQERNGSENGSGASKDVKEGNSEDLKEGESEEPKERNSEKRKEGNSEEPSKNSDNVQEGNSEDTKKPTSE